MTQPLWACISSFHTIQGDDSRQKSLTLTCANGRENPIFHPLRVPSGKAFFNLPLHVD
jgi:hypothetical protein